MNAGSQPWPPQFNGFINDALLQLSSDTGKALLQVIDVPVSLSGRRIFVSARRSCSRLGWGLVSSLASDPVQWSLGFHVVAAWWFPCTVCRCAVLLEDEQVPWHKPDGCQHLLLREDVSVVYTVDLDFGLDEEHIQTVRTPEFWYSDGYHDWAAEHLAGVQEALGVNVTLHCCYRHIKTIILSIDQRCHCKHLFISKPDEADAVLWKLPQKLLASYQAWFCITRC